MVHATISPPARPSSTRQTARALLDGEGRIRAANLPFCELVSARQADVLERPFADLIPEEWGVDRVRALLDDVKRQPEMEWLALDNNLPQTGGKLHLRAYCLGGGTDEPQTVVEIDLTPDRDWHETDAVFRAAMLDAIPSAVIGMDAEGCIRYWNQPAHYLYGWSAAEVLGRHVQESVLQAITSDELESVVEALMQDGQWSGELTVQRKNGVQFPARFMARPLFDEAGQLAGFVGVSSDVSRGQRIELALTRVNKRLEMLRTMDRKILAAQSPEAIAVTVLDAIGQLIPAIYSSVLLFEFEQEAAIVLASSGEASLEIPQGSRVQATKASIPPQLLAGQDHVIPDIAALPNPLQSVRALQQRGVRSLVMSPLMVEGELIGALSICSSIAGAFPVEDVSFIRELADQIAIALQQARLYARVQEYAEELEQRVVERTHELQDAKDRMEAILQNTSDSIVLLDDLLDPEGTILRTNRAFEAQFGYPYDELVGQALEILLAPESFPVLAEAITHLKRDRSERVEVLCRRKDGSLFHADAALSLVNEDFMGYQTIVCSFRDITVRKQMEEDLRRTLEKERELGELKVQFISMVSHEFRTPLSVIQSSLDLYTRYRERLDEDRRRELLNDAQVHLTRMKDLLDDFLAFNRAEVVGFDANREPVDLQAMLQNLIDGIAPLYTSHHFQLTATGPVHPVPIDAKLMRHALTNLVTNAVKYSPAGSTVRVSLEFTAHDVKIRVRDTGYGIPAADQPHLFEPFHRGRNIKTIGGTGLGLAITKRAIDAHEGSIAVESEEGVGTTFTVTLPVR